jgi:predicted dehydrogenase
MNAMGKSLTVAIIGAGRWGPNLIRNFDSDPRTTVGWVIDQSPERRSQVSLRFPGVAVGANYAEALEDPTIDAVVIATPATTHFDIASRFIESGRHCFVEKPLATSLEDATKLCIKAEEMDVVLAVGHVFLYNPAILRVKRYLEEGDVGEIRYVSLVRTNLGPPGIDVNVAWDLATHDVSIANYWLGSPPVSVIAAGGSWIEPEKEDTVFAVLRYPEGALVHINVSWLNPVKTRAITVVGSRKMVTIDDINLDEPVRIYDKGIDPEPNEFIDSFGAFRATIRNGDVTIPRIPGREPLREECLAFIDAALGGSPPVSSGRSALPVIATIEAIEASMRDRGAEKDVVWP